MPLEKLLESSFIGNLTDDATDRLYQAAAEANLAIIYHQHYYAQGGRKLLFARAVLEWNQRMYVLWMNEEMQELVRTSVVIEESDCILLERSDLAAVLAQAAAKVKEEKKRAARMNGCGADTKNTPPAGHKNTDGGTKRMRRRPGYRRR